MVAGKDDLTKKTRLGATLGRLNLNARSTYNAENLWASLSRGAAWASEMCLTPFRSQVTHTANFSLPIWSMATTRST